MLESIGFVPSGAKDLIKIVFPNDQKNLPQSLEPWRDTAISTPFV